MTVEGVSTPAAGCAAPACGVCVRRAIFSVWAAAAAFAGAWGALLEAGCAEAEAVCPFGAEDRAFPAPGLRPPPLASRVRVVCARFERVCCALRFFVDRCPCVLLRAVCWGFEREIALVMADGVSKGQTVFFRFRKAHVLQSSSPKLPRD